MANITIPEVDKNRPNRWWFKHEIYDGPNNEGRIVPNPNDAVLDWNGGVFRVIAVDYGNTNMSILQRTNPFTIGGGAGFDDVSVITGPGVNATNFRVYVDTATVPHVMSVDSRCYWNGSENSYIKVFRGTDTSAAKGVVISAILNQSGQVSSENIPLDTIVVPNGTNIAKKSARSAYCSETVTDGEIVTIVTYSKGGAITSVDRFVVKTTNAVRTLDQSSTYVVGIELITPFLSGTDKRLVECPINMLAQSLQLTAKVTYDDGKSVTYPVDGTRFTLAGKDFLVSSQIGQVIDVVLLYNLAANELYYDATANLPNRVISEPYRIKVTDVDTYYSVKLYVIPEWTGSQYALRYYVNNLERNILTDVTSKIEFPAGSPVFNGKKYDGVQSLTPALNLATLGSSFSTYRHVQPIKVTLMRPGNLNESTDFYRVEYAPTAVYGEQVKGMYSTDTANGNKQVLDLSCNNRTVVSWLNHMYYSTDPLRHEILEPKALAPTHVVLRIGTNYLKEIQVTDILNPVVDIPAGTMGVGTNIRLEFISKQSSGNKLLATVGLLSTLVSAVE